MIAAVAAGVAAISLPAALALGVAVVAAGETEAVALGPGVPAEYVSAILDASASCKDADLPPNVLAAQLKKESGFNPDVTSPAGAQGIAQFLPSTWATWGTDGDGDGKAQITNPFDAIASQGNFMCSLLKQFGEIELALAAYNAGPGAVEQYAGIPPYAETVDYVETIMKWAASADFAVEYAPAGEIRWDGSPVDEMLPKGYRNPRSAKEAVKWAQSQVGVYRDAGHCLKFVNDAFGSNNGRYPTAYDVWENAPENLKHTNWKEAPPGAVHLWNRQVGDTAGHIAISIGNGRMITTTGGAVAEMPTTGYADMTHYVGWMPPKVASGNGG